MGTPRKRACNDILFFILYSIDVCGLSTSKAITLLGERRHYGIINAPTTLDLHREWG